MDILFYHIFCFNARSYSITQNVRLSETFLGLYSKILFKTESSPSILFTLSVGLPFILQKINSFATFLLYLFLPLLITEHLLKRQVICLSFSFHSFTVLRYLWMRLLLNLRQLITNHKNYKL